MAMAYRDGKYYRARAEECRVVGEILATPDLREKMQKIATDYERMAVAADQAIDAMDAAICKTCDDRHLGRGEVPINSTR